MSPEVAKGARADWKADQYALGVTFYELLAGAKPYRTDKFEATLYKHIHDPVPDPRRVNGQISKTTARIAAKMMAKDPRDRLGSYDQIISALEIALAEA